MARGNAILAMVAIAAMAGVFAVTLVTEDAFVEPGPFSISYELYGGTNDPSNPSMYDVGDEFEFEPATQDGMVFIGWYKDPELKKRIDSVGASTRGDLTLYAGWEKDRSGSSFTFSVSGYIDDGTRTTKYSGTEKVSLAYYSGYKLSYYVQTDSQFSQTTYKFNKIEKQWDETVTDAFWGSKVLSAGDLVGSEAVSGPSGDVDCWIYRCASSDGATVKIWKGMSDGTPYKVTADREGHHRTMTLTESGQAEVREEVQFLLYGGCGMIASHSGSSKPGQIATISTDIPVGKVFTGWYDADGNLVSSDASFEMEVGIEDVELYARTAGYDIETSAGSTATLSVGFGLTSATWSVECDTAGVDDDMEGVPLTYTFQTPGEYEILVDGTCTDGTEHRWYLTAYCSGTVGVQYSWTYAGEELTYALDIKYGDYVAARDSIPVSERRHTDAAGDARFVTYSDPYVALIAKDLRSMASDRGLSEVKTADFILGFVQSLKYASDESLHGTEEYWALPLETLFLSSGDCEDTSVLYCAMMSSLGYRTSILLFPSHAAAGLNIDGVTGQNYLGDLKYYYCETTSTGYSVGQKPADVDNRASAVIEIPMA